MVVSFLDFCATLAVMQKKYQKDFARWAQVAEGIERRKRPEMIKPGVIYWCNVGVNVGTIEDGKGPRFTRPALVLSTSEGGQVIIVPITSQKKAGPNSFEIVVNGRIEHLLFAQMRPIDALCLEAFIDELDDATFMKARNKLLKYMRLIFFPKS